MYINFKRGKDKQKRKISNNYTKPSLRERIKNSNTGGTAHLLVE